MERTLLLIALSYLVVERPICAGQAAHVPSLDEITTPNLEMRVGPPYGAQTPVYDFRPIYNGPVMSAPDPIFISPNDENYKSDFQRTSDTIKDAVMGELLYKPAYDAAKDAFAAGAHESWWSEALSRALKYSMEFGFSSDIPVSDMLIDITLGISKFFGTGVSVGFGLLDPSSIAEDQPYWGHLFDNNGQYTPTTFGALPDPSAVVSPPAPACGLDDLNCAPTSCDEECYCGLHPDECEVATCDDVEGCVLSLAAGNQSSRSVQCSFYTCLLDTTGCSSGRSTCGACPI